jgi:membrane protease YdiL (CAAX protease family)
VPWTVLDAAGLVLWTIVAQMLVALPVALLLQGSATAGVSAAILLVVEVATFAGVVAWLRHRHTWSWRLLGPLRPAARHLAVGLGVGVAGFLIAVIVPEILRQSFDLPTPEPQQILDVISADGAGTVWLIAVVVLLAPIVEELVFRGVLFQSLRHRLGLWPGIGISSLTFAFVHLELIDKPLSLAALLVFAVWLAAAFHRTGTLVVPVVAHATFNAINIAAVLTLPTG